MAAVNMNQEMFEKAILGDKPVLVDFWAPWCTYCRRISDAYDRIAQKYEGRILVTKINIDEEPALAQQEGIEIIPTLVLYHKGMTLGSVINPESESAIDEFISGTLSMEQKQKAVHVHDMIIIGGGPGGYTAALYAARSGLDAIVLEKLSAGGQMAQTHQIDNYPGFEDGVDGYELGQKMLRQAQRFGAQTAYAEVTRVDLMAEPKVIETSEGVYYGKAVVIATGAGPRELGVEGEKELVGRGVAYCAACDGMFFKGKTVAVVGGGNSAAADALLLSRIAERVIVIHRRDTLRATKVYHEPLMQAENVEFRWDSVVTALEHEDKLTGVRLKNVKSGEESSLEVDGLFVSVGRKPNTQLFDGQVELTAGGYIAAGEDTRTNIPGVYAVGDVREKQLRQIVTAVADGAVAVHMAEEYLAGK
ncbi:MAG: thioredoxin-disulfide reductase [Clostridia bacterium]|nr:thioredoxin-disulfide reductase [Clostridia bacterium]